MRKTVKVSNITCAQCAKTIENHFSKKENIDVKVSVTDKKVIFNYDKDQYDLDMLHDNLQSIGYYPIIDQAGQQKLKRKDLIDLWIAIIFSVPLLWTMANHLSLPIYTPAIFENGYFQLALTIPILFYAGRRFFIQGYYQMKLKAPGMDVLIVLGTVAAFIYSTYQTIRHQEHMMHGNHLNLYFETAAVIILMVLIGNYFENRIKERTSDTLQSLLSLGVKEARVRKDGKDVMIPLDDVNVDDEIIVFANEKVPLDGIVVTGSSYIDESMITGEPMPKMVEQNKKVVGSTINLVETITIKVTAVGTDTVLQQIIKTVEDASLMKPKAQRIADKIASYFVPAVTLIALCVFLWFSVFNQDFLTGFERSIAVLLISCPCALGLATPTSISVASGMAFKHGILYKGGEFFENAFKLDAMAFDKTGTLTYGKPSVTDFITFDDDSFKYTYALEHHSNHPIAQAVLMYQSVNLLDVSSFESMIGLGLKGIIDSKQVYVGSIKLLEHLKITHPWEEKYQEWMGQGKTVIFTVVENECVNMIAIFDEIKPDAKALIELLKSKGIETLMITGDQEKTAQTIAAQIGIDRIYASVLPHEKAGIIQDIQKTHNMVGFIGDGINDAPALKVADCGFAVSSGTDIALDAADVTFMKQELMLLWDAIHLSKATLINIYLNFFWAFIYNIVMIPFAALGYINPTLAGIGMGFSSIMVVLNALSLKLYKFKHQTKEE